MAGGGKMFIILVMMCMTLKNHLICSFYCTKKVQYVERPQNLLGQPADLLQKHTKFANTNALLIFPGTCIHLPGDGDWYDPKRALGTRSGPNADPHFWDLEILLILEI